MSDDSKPIGEHKTVRARICFSDELPEGCPQFELPPGTNMMEIELEDETLIVVRPGGMTRPLYDEWNTYLDRVTTQGHWTRESTRADALRTKP
jgi:hypothetical protein